MNLRQVESFVAVAEHLSFTKAAADLGIAQPPLSQNVRRLERTIGAELFRRDRRIVELTDVGRAFLPRAKALLNQASIARGEVARMVGLGDADLRVGASGTLAAFLLPDLVTSFRQSHPNIAVTIAQQRSETILERVERGDLDIGLLRLPLRSTDLETTRLSSEPLFAAVPPEHAASERAEVSIADLRDDPFIMCVDAREPFYTVVSELCIAAGFVPKVICAGAEYTTVFRLVGMGQGVSVASALATRMQVDPAPTFVPLTDADARITTAVVAGPRAARSAVAEAFRAQVLDHAHAAAN